MTDDLDQALADAQQMAEGWRQRTPADTPASERKTIYVFEGCECLDQRGRNYRYHIHSLTPERYNLFWAGNQHLQVVARYDA